MQNSMLSEIHPRTLDQEQWCTCELPRPAPSLLISHVYNLSFPQVQFGKGDGCVKLLSSTELACLPVPRLSTLWKFSKFVGGWRFIELLAVHGTSAL